MFHVKHAEGEEMELNEFKAELKSALERNLLGELYNDIGAEKLFGLTAIMLKVNESMNLTAITDERSVILKHYVDSLTVSAYIPEGAAVIDVGCGAGFPCMPLAIFRPDLKVTALDSTAKRINYLSETADALDISNITPIAARAEEYAREPAYRESFDAAVARAVAAMPILVELCLPFVKVGGRFIAMKASQGLRELDDSQNAIKLCGGELLGAHSFDLISSDSSEQRVIIEILKKSPTPLKYPRHYSQISKRHL